MKRSMICIVLIFAAWQGYSQSLSYGFGIGLNSSLNSSNLILDNYSEQNSNYKFGFHFNVMCKYNFNEKFGVSFEPGFAKRGAIFRFPNTKINLNYLIFPVAANYKLFNKFLIFIGPEFSYRMSAKGKTDGEINDVHSVYNSKIDFGVIVGLSYQILDKFDIGIRYNRGVISTIKDIRFMDKNGNDKGKANVFNQGFTLSVTYMIK